MVETSDAWIKKRTGIIQRRIIGDDQTTSDLIVNAARKAMAKRNLRGEDLDLILVATITPDRKLPATASYVQHKLKATNAVAFDIAAACSGFIYGLQLANSLIRHGLYRKVLLVGAEVLSNITDWTDRTTCVLFGDGAGAAIIEPIAADREGIISTQLYTDGSRAHVLTVPGGGTYKPYNEHSIRDKDIYVFMDGPAVFEFAVGALEDMSRGVIDKSPYEMADVDWFVPHQANTRIIKSAAKRMGAPMDKFYMNIQRYGNTSSASIPICLAEMHASNLLAPGQLVCLSAFGAGLTAGGALLRWII